MNLNLLFKKLSLKKKKKGFRDNGQLKLQLCPPCIDAAFDSEGLSVTDKNIIVGSKMFHPSGLPKKFIAR